MSEIGEVYDHFRIDGEIGRGGMGVVYAATDTRLNRPVALKVISSQYAADSSAVARFLREADVLSRLDSPHIIAIYDAGETHGSPYIASQYVAGGDLGTLIRQRGALPPALALEICAQIADALGDAHAAGVVHRDVKPSNVLLRDADASHPHAYLCDFGIATSETTDGLTRPGQIAGSWGYLAPERIEGRPATPASDVYAMGCLLWACLVGGQPPYTGSDYEVGQAHLNAPIPQLPDSAPDAARINRVLATALAKDPADRYASTEDLKGALLEAGRGAGGSGPIAAGPASYSSAAASPAAASTSKRWPLLVAAVVVLALVGAGGVWALTRGDDDGEQAGGGSPTTSGGSSQSPTDEASVATLSPEDRPRDPDVNADGKSDLVLAGFGSADVWLSTGDGFEQSDPEDTEIAFVGDVDGNGSTDVVEGSTVVYARDENEYVVRYAEGGLASTTIRLPGPRLESFQPMADDVDGDGALDLVFVQQPDGGRTEGKIVVARGTEDGFAKPETWHEGYVGDYKTQWHLGDFTGDGKADMVLISPIGNTNGRMVEIARSTGQGWKSVGNVTRVSKSYQVAVGDPDGDGDDDLVIVETNDEGTWLKVREWTGKNFSPASFWLSSTDLADIGAVVLGDYDGDGRDDLLLGPHPTGDARELFVSLSDGEKFADPESWVEVPCDGGDCVTADTVQALGAEPTILG